MPRKPVLGQTSAFFDAPPAVPVVPEGHAGTQLDPTWTVEVGEGWYDQSVRIFQTMFIELPGGRYGVRSADLAKVKDKTDWVELISPMGAAFQIPMRRLMTDGVGITDMGERWLAAPSTSWRQLDGPTNRTHTDPPGHSRSSRGRTSSG
jgi:hypothetical protein